MKKKILTILTIGTAVLFLAGCGNKPAASNDQSGQAPKNPVDSSSQVANDENDNLPAPTGKVDDALKAVDDQSNLEKNQATDDDNDAKSAAGNGQETNDLSNSYDQNEIQ